MDDQQARERVALAESLLEEVERLQDAVAREKSLELVGALLDLYGEGLARMLARVNEPAALADDELVSHLLYLHDLHPVPVEERVRGALDEVRPYLESHGGNVELVAVAEGVVRLRLEGSCSGCPSSAVTLKLAVEDAIHKAAPEIADIQAEDAAPSAEPALIQLVPIAPHPDGNGAWATAGALPQLRGGGLLVKEIAGEPVLFCDVEGTPYAYRPGCPACGGSLGEGRLEGAMLICGGCGHAYEVTRAGCCADEPELHLDPVPLLVDDGGLAKVALAAP